ncbi:MAG: ABC transporter substrate-binding protein, partial [Candidatus Bathyarchaeia archaeon]
MIREKRSVSALTKIGAAIIAIIVIIAIIGGVVYYYTSLPAPKPVPEKIKIGFTLSKTGYGVAGSTLLHEQQYFLWLDQINKKGGVYVPEFGKRIPVEFIWYDDRSDPATVIEHYTKLITEDKVDFLLPPWGSHFNLAVAPVISEYKFPLIGSTCYSTTILTERNTKFPYYYSLLPQVDALVPTFMEWLNYLRDNRGFRKVALIYN